MSMLGTEILTRWNCIRTSIAAIKDGMQLLLTLRVRRNGLDGVHTNPSETYYGAHHGGATS